MESRMGKQPQRHSAEVAQLMSMVTFRLARTQNKLSAQMSHLLRTRCDLTLAEFRVLRLLAVQPSTSMADLARQMGMDKGQLSRKIKAMQAQDLVDLTPNRSDNRKQDLRITSKGMAEVDALMPLALHRQELLRRNISDEEMAVFLRVLDRLEDAAEIRDL